MQIQTNTDIKPLGAYLSGVMHRLGIPSSLLGYRYIINAVSLILDSKEMLDSVTSVLYPTVARINGTTPSRVERAIRHAVTVSMERGDTRFINSVFSYTVNSAKGKPTNSEFISMLAEYVYYNR